MHDSTSIGPDFTAEAFRAWLDKSFDVDSDAGTVPLRLVEVADGRTGGGFVSFSVVFHGPPDPVLPQGTYTFRHSAGTFALFIVPVVGSSAERIVYEACFSQRIAPSGR